MIVADFDATGISSVASKLNEMERTKILKEFLPERIYTDYVRLAKADSTLLELTPFFNNTNGFQKLIFNVVAILIKIRTFHLKIKLFFKKFKKR